MTRKDYITHIFTLNFIMLIISIIYGYFISNHSQYTIIRTTFEIYAFSALASLFAAIFMHYMRKASIVLKIREAVMVNFISVYQNTWIVMMIIIAAGIANM